MIAGSEGTDPGANGLDHSGSFMTSAKRQWTNVIASKEMNITVAEAARDVAHKHLMGPRLIDIDVDNFVAARTLKQDSGS